MPAASHLSGFGVAEKDKSLDRVLNEMAHRPAKGRDNFVVAMRASSGVQASGWHMPTILPEHLGEETHLACALRLQHPLARPPPLADHLECALNDLETWANISSRCVRI